jgi:hypothetical protein
MTGREAGRLVRSRTRTYRHSLQRLIVKQEP